MNTRQLGEAYILHSRSYRDTSLIVDLLGRVEGRYSVVVRGARSEKSRLRGRLQPFTPLLVGATGRGELKTATTIDFAGSTAAISGEPLFLGLYINELLYRLLGKYDPMPALFDDYRALLDVLVRDEDSTAYIRLFELRLLQALGYGINVQFDAGDGQPVVADGRYRFVVNEGFYRTERAGDDIYPGAELHAIEAGNLRAVDARRLRRLTRNSLAELLGDKPLKSRALFQARSRESSGGAAG
jgi:DNA repair protein RecO (recombination protein O)